jgi:RNase adaptor protein for sRNA GlmZ degradation
MTELKQFKEISVRKPLVVRVYSFSYKKGIPADESGNGGGFVFDCRAVNNPGKYERYNFMTGMDEPVIKFLEDDGEIFPFLEAAYSLVDASVKRYIDRGFRNLMVSFGCTGGQHRSVYSAEKMAQHINEKFGVEVQLIHREQNIENVLPARELKVEN